jgi:hypothetical protein
MPQKFATLAEARNAVLLASSTWRAQFDKMTRVQDLKVATNDALDVVAASTVHALEEVHSIKEEAATYRQGVTVSHALATQAMAESKAAIDRLAKVEDVTKKSIGAVSRKCTTNSSRVQDMQLSMSENVLIIRGIPSKAANPEKESPAEIEEAFNEAMGLIRCPKLRLHSIKRLQRSKRADTSAPRVLRVALANAIEKNKLFTAIETCTKANAKVPFSCSHEIPRYAINSYKHCNKLATLCRVGDSNCKVRVQIPRGERWPAILIKRQNDKEFRKLTKVELTQVKAELAGREKREREGRKQSAAGTSAMAVDNIQNLSIRYNHSHEQE